MLNTRDLLDNRDAIVKRLERRQNYPDIQKVVDQAIEKEKERKSLKTDLDQRLAEANQMAKSIGQLFASGKNEEANKLREQVAATKENNKELEEQLKKVENEVEELLLQIPNVPHDSVPAGKGEEDNIVYQDFSGPLPDLGPDALPHWELGKKYRILDFELGAKITGSGFPLFRGKGSQLQRALVSYFLKSAEAAGFEEITPPLLVNASSAKGTGQLPDKEGQMYYAPEDDLYLIPTSEVPITNIYRDTILEESDFPIKMTGHTPCFRREAGSYGSDVKGLNRVHQFEKVEIVCLEHPSRSYDMLDKMVKHVESLLVGLKLPYRILLLSGGDLGFTSALTYDFEVYSAAQKKWLEVSSVSNFESYQANRLKLRYRDSEGKTQLAHTLNGSALALARIIATILENYQTKDGIQVPEVLLPYLEFTVIK